MKKLILGGLAALAISLAAAPVAGAGTPTNVSSSRQQTR